MERKLMSRKGFTITEMLMSILIIGLLVSIVGGGVVVVKDAYTKITLKAEAETLRSTAITAVMDELRYAQYIEVADNPQADTEEKVIVFDSPSRGYRMYFLPYEEGADEGICVSAYLESGEAQKIPLLTGRTTTTKLVPRLTLTFQEPQEDKPGYFTIQVDIYKKGDSKNKFVSTREPIIVQPLNSRAEE